MNRTLVAFIMICAGVAASVRADDPAPLSGPKVEDKGIPGESKPFGVTGSKLKHEVKLIDDRILIQALGALRGGAVKDEVRLTVEQESVIREANEKVVAARREYLLKNEAEIKSALTDLGIDVSGIKGERGLREALEQARKTQAGGKKSKATTSSRSTESGMTEASEQQRAAAVQKLAELRERAPKSDDAHAAIWASLTTEQKSIVQAKIKELEDLASAKKALPGAERKASKKLKNKAAAPNATPEGAK